MPRGFLRRQGYAGQVPRGASLYVPAVLSCDPHRTGPRHLFIVLANPHVIIRFAASGNEIPVFPFDIDIPWQIFLLECDGAVLDDIQL